MKNYTSESPCYSDSPALVVDDDSASREILVELLKELGFTNIVEKNSGRAAIDFIQSHEDWRGIVLSDWNMPNMSGAELHLHIKRNYPNIPFIIVTGRNDEDSVLLAKDTGIYAYIVKPYSLSELERKVTKVSMNHSKYLYTAPSTEAMAIKEEAYTI